MPQTVIQKIRISKNLSQSQLATLSGVNLRTLQDFEQGRKPLKNAKGEMLYRLSIALDCSINDLLCDSILDIDLTDSRDDSHLKKYSKLLSTGSLYGKYYSFPVIVPNSKINMQRVYPTKQALVNELHNRLYSDPRITSIMLFGSSVTMQCNRDSDTDLAVRLQENRISTDIKNNVSEIIQEVCDWNADIIWFDRIAKSDRIYHDICKGVQIV